MSDFLVQFDAPRRRRSVLAGLAFEQFTETTLKDATSMMAKLTLTRARGYAVSFEEHLSGVNSVAVAVAEKDGVPIGAPVVLGPSTRLDSAQIHPVGRELIAAARRITGSIGAISRRSGLSST